MKPLKELPLFLFPMLLLCVSVSAQDRVRTINAPLSTAQPCFCCRLANSPCKKPRQMLWKNLWQKWNATKSDCANKS